MVPVEMKVLLGSELVQGHKASLSRHLVIQQTPGAPPALEADLVAHLMERISMSGAGNPQVEAHRISERF